MFNNSNGIEFIICDITFKIFWSSLLFLEWSFAKTEITKNCPILISGLRKTFKFFVVKNEM